MYEGSLFEKLTGSLKEIKNDEKSALYRSIANNLTNIFISNAGSSESSFFLGRPEINDETISVKDAISNINQQLKKVILLYEPRLHDVSVVSSLDERFIDRINVYIRGHMKVHDEDCDAEYHAYINRKGILKIKYDK